MNRIFQKFALAAVAVVPGLALATGPTYDTTDAVAAITAGNVAIAALGVAALVMVVGLKVWKRLRGAA